MTTIKAALQPVMRAVMRPVMDPRGGAGNGVPIPPPDSGLPSFLLNEGGDFILLESGDKIVLE